MSEGEVIDFKAAARALAKVQKENSREQVRENLIEHEWEKGLLFDEKGKVDRSSGANVTLILSHHPAWHGAIAYNEFAERVEIRRSCPAGEPGEWADVHDKLTSDWLERSKYNLRPSGAAVHHSVDAVARASTFHPVREYLDGLAWDGVPRIDDVLITHFGAIVEDEASSAYLKLVARIFMLGPVARIMRPGCLLRTVPILEGKQERNKSKSVRALCPQPEWFSDSEIPIGTKDAFQNLKGKWIIELSEIDKDLKGAKSAAAVKAFISSPSDNYRQSYGRRNTDNPRQCAFFGTTNQDRYLNDETGGTRFLPVAVTEGNPIAVERDRDQLWAEAVHRFRAGEQWWAEREDSALAHEEQRQRYDGDEWVALIEEFVNNAPPVGTVELLGRGEVPFIGVTVPWLLSRLGLPTSDHSLEAQRRVGKCLRHLGWSKRRKRGKDARANVWERDGG